MTGYMYITNEIIPEGQQRNLQNISKEVPVIGREDDASRGRSGLFLRR